MPTKLDLEDAFKKRRLNPMEPETDPMMAPTTTSPAPIQPAATPIAGAPTLPEAAPPRWSQQPPLSSGAFGRTAENILKEYSPPNTGGPDLSGAGVDLPKSPWNPSGAAYSPIAKQEHDFMTAGMKPGKDGRPQLRRGWMDALKSAGIGFLQGAASNPENPLAAGLGGAVAGGAITGIDPMRGRRYQFETLERPRIEAEEQRNTAYQGRMRKAVEEALGMRGLEARTQREEFEARDLPARQRREEDESRVRLDRTRAETENLRRPQVTKASSPEWKAVRGPDGREMYVDLNAPENRGKSFTPVITDRPESPDQRYKAAERALELEQGTIDQIARDSMRGREEAILRKLSQKERSALQFPDKTKPEALEAARSAYQKLWDMEFKDVRDRAEGQRRKDASARSGAGQSASPAPAAPPKPGGSPGPGRKLSTLKDLLK